MKNIIVLIRKEWRSLFSDGTLSVLLLIMFTVLVYQTAHSGGTELRNATVGVVDLDKSRLSRQIIDALPSGYFSPPEYLQQEDVDKRMDKGDFVFVMAFPPNFERDVLMNRQPEIQLLIDATALTQAGIGQGYITQITQREINEFLGQQTLIEQILPTKTNIKVAFNPNIENTWFLGAMQVNNMLTMLCLILVGAAVIREREQGTMEHLLVMPVTSTQIVLAKILANGIIVCVCATLSMYFMVGSFIGTHINGSIWLYFLGTLVFMFSIASFAVMLATVAPTMPQYSLLIVPLYVVALMFSGSSSPRNNMPEFAQNISAYWPTTQFATMAQNVIFRGAGWEIVWQPLLIMSISGAIFLGLALLRFKKMLEKQA